MQNSNNQVSVQNGIQAQQEVKKPEQDSFQSEYEKLFKQYYGINEEKEEEEENEKFSLVCDELQNCFEAVDEFGGKHITK